jgi:hypothetical protein
MADQLVERSAGGRAGALARPLLSLRVPALSRAQRATLAFAAAAGAIVAVHAPVLGRYFFNDDFVPLADIATHSTPGYIKDLFLLRDLTPNWRFLTGLYYLGAYRAFGLNAFPYFLISVAVHLATAGLIFWFVRRALDSDWAGFLASAFFGLSAAPVPTVGQVTAFNNVLAAFLVMLAIVCLYEGLERRTRPGWWLAAPTIAFAAAIAANESSMVVAPVFGLIALWKLPQAERWWQWPRAWAIIAFVAAPFALLGGAALAGFGSCHCTETGLYVHGGHIVSNVWLYLGRLLYPVGMEFPGHLGMAHIAAGSAVLALMLVALARGPALARVCAVFLLLAIAPYLPIKLWGATRYTYLASVPFSILAAVLFAEAARYGRRLTPALPFALAVVAFGVLGLYGWQTWTQNHQQAEASDGWRTLVTALREAYPQVPAGSVVYVRGGPLTNELMQCTVMPALGHVLWGDALLFTVPLGDLQSYAARPGYHVYVGDFVDGRIVPAPVPVATAADMQRSDVKLLPQVSPEAKGNLCRLDVPRPL